MYCPFTLQCAGFACLRSARRARTNRVSDWFAEMVLTLPSTGTSYFVKEEKNWRPVPPTARTDSPPWQPENRATLINTATKAIMSPPPPADSRSRSCFPAEQGWQCRQLSHASLGIPLRCLCRIKVRLCKSLCLLHQFFFER